MPDLPVAEQTLVGRVTGGHVDDLPFADVTAALGLGKYVAVGFNGAPTWINPAATDWADVVANDYGWIQFIYGLGGDAVDIYAGRGDGTNNFNLFIAADGAVFFVISGPNGAVQFQSSVAQGSGLSITPAAGQLLPMISLNSEFEVGPGGSVGGVTPSVGWVMKWDGTKWVASAP